jgi:catechol 2,3-dioxygenase-like lactoylglutathione lyase family enzyme
MIDHVSLGVTQLDTAARFYDAALATIGMARKLEFPHAIAYGRERPLFWIVASGADGFRAGPGLHVALAAPTPGSVDAFHAAALAHGGRDAGAPGPRPEYRPDYYAAFVLDPDGSKIEAVCRTDAPLVTT